MLLSDVVNSGTNEDQRVSYILENGYQETLIIKSAGVGWGDDDGKHF